MSRNAPPFGGALRDIQKNGFERDYINTELNLFQELESAVHRSDLVIRLYLADWFVAVDLLIFHLLMIPNNDAPVSRKLPAKARVIWLCV